MTLPDHPTDPPPGGATSRQAKQMSAELDLRELADDDGGEWEPAEPWSAAVWVAVVAIGLAVLSCVAEWRGWGW